MLTPERVNEIFAAAVFGNLSKQMTDAEIAEVRTKWDTMSGNTCFADALNTFRGITSRSGIVLAMDLRAAGVDLDEL